MTTNNPISVLREALTEARAALASCYNVQDSPEDCTSAQYKAIRTINGALATTEQAAIQPAGGATSFEGCYRSTLDYGNRTVMLHFYSPDVAVAFHRDIFAAPAAQQAKAEQVEWPDATDHYGIDSFYDAPTATPASKPEASGRIGDDAVVLCEFIDQYEWRTDEFCHTPTGREREMLHDFAVMLHDARQPVAAPSDDAYLAQYEMLGRIAEKDAALLIAEAALSDIGDADREPGDDLAWCERRAAEALPAVRAAMPRHSRTPPGKSAAPVAPEQAVSDAKRSGTLYQAAIRACGELPDGYEIRIELERGCGMVAWYDEDANRTVIEGEGYLCSDVEEALAAILAKRSGGTA